MAVYRNAMFVVNMLLIEYPLISVLTRVYAVVASKRFFQMQKIK